MISMATATARRSSPRRSSRSNAAARDAARAKRAALLEQLNTFTAALEIDPDETALERIAAWERHYSARNAILIVMQRADATDLRSYVAWKEAGRQVRDGEHGIQVLAPAGQTKGDTGPERPGADTGEQGEKTRQHFKLIYLFDVAQTDEITEGATGGHQ
jgi:hypothetical protein